MSGHSGAQVEVTAPARLRRMGEWGVEGGGKVSEGGSREESITGLLRVWRLFKEWLICIRMGMLAKDVANASPARVE